MRQWFVLDLLAVAHDELVERRELPRERGVRRSREEPALEEPRPAENVASLVICDAREREQHTTTASRDPRQPKAHKAARATAAGGLPLSRRRVP